MVFLYGALIVIIFLIDGIPLIKKKEWKGLFIFSVLITVAITIVVGNYVGLPSPVSMMNDTFYDLGKKLFGELGGV